MGIGDSGTAVAAWDNDGDIEYYASCCAPVSEGGLLGSPTFP